MKIAPLAQVKDHFSEYVNACQESPVIVTKNGKAVAMLVPIQEDDDLDTLILSHNPRLLAIIEEGYKSVKATGGVSHKEFWAAVKKRKTRKKAS
jgi:prevent-host-death family protein